MDQSIAAFDHDIATGRWRHPDYLVAPLNKRAMNFPRFILQCLGAARSISFMWRPPLSLGQKFLLPLTGGRQPWRNKLAWR